MLLLVVDSAGPKGGVLLARSKSAASGPSETEILGTRVLETREFSAQLISAAAELLRVNRLTVADMDAFAIVSGPGSFTGLRVGLSAVKAIAEVTAKPVIALSRLAIMASAAEVRWSGEIAASPVHAVLDAGRGEFYHGIYRDAGWTCVTESLQTLTSLMWNIERVPGLVVASEAAVLSALVNLAPRPIPSPTVSAALPLALAALHARRFSDVAILDANYLRRIDPAPASKEVFAAEHVDRRARS